MKSRLKWSFVPALLVVAFTPFLMGSGCDPKDNGESSIRLLAVGHMMNGVYSLNVFHGSTNDPTSEVSMGLEFTKKTAMVPVIADRDGNVWAKACDAETGAELYRGPSYMKDSAFMTLVGPRTAPKAAVAEIGMQDPPTLHFVNGDHMNPDQKLEFYVTAPGADLTTPTPDLPGIAYGEAKTALDAAHVDATFQVRACIEGTKTVVATFSVVTGAPAKRHYVFVVGRGGTSIVPCTWFFDFPAAG